MNKSIDNSLQELVKSLDENEMAVLQTSISSFSGKSANSLKTIELLSVLRQAEENLSDQDCSLLIYGKKKDNNFEKLKSRLRNKILDSLILDVNLDRHTNWDELNVKTIKIRKKFAAYLTLNLINSDLKIKKKLLLDIIAQCKKFELYSMLLEGLRLLKYDYGIKKSENYFNNVNKKIDYYEKCLTLTRKTNDFYFIVGKRLNFSSQLEKEKLVKFIKINLDGLSVENKFYNLPYVNYLFITIEILQSLVLEDNSKAKQLSEKLNIIINEQPSVFNTERQAGNLIRLNQLEILEGNFDKALNYVIRAQSILIPNTRNYFFAKDLEFHSYYYHNKISKAADISEYLLTARVDIIGPFFYSKYKYYSANILFKLKRYNDALKSLRENSALRDDKSGWDIGLRVLTILCHIELGNYDQAMSATEAMRKHINRSGRTKPVGDRELIIFQMLNSLSLNSYDFQKTYVTQEKNLKLLKSNDPKVKYQYLEHELVKFDEWFEGKVKSK